MYAACYGESESVIRLVQHGADLFLVHQRDKMMVADYAIDQGHPHIIDDLVNFLRKFNRSEAAMRVLDRALCHYFTLESGRRLDVSITKRLLELGADPDVDTRQSSLMHMADSELEVHLLLNARFTAIHRRDRDGVTPLMKIISLLDHHSATRILRQDVFVNRQHDKGWTAFHHLVEPEYLPLRFLRHVINDAKEEQYAQKAKMISCWHLLLKSRADLAIHDKCKCLCGPNGCSAITILLRRTAEGAFNTPYFPGLLADICCVLHNQNAVYIEQFLEDITRYREYATSGLTHKCCQGWRRSVISSKHYDAWGNGTASEVDVVIPNAATRTRGSNDRLGIDRVIEKLAGFYHELERRSSDAHDAAIDRIPHTVRPVLTIVVKVRC